ncbi:MAG: TonB-dependent receptor, partial [Ignavibacteriaceae bacterium]|nr:TonB-dependent receptor [Ignavibacteriaceae bacterium]
MRGTNTGTATDNNGFFSLKNLNIPAVSLTVSIIGYKSEAVKIAGSNYSGDTIFVPLKETLIELGSVVVTGTNNAHLYENVPVKTELVTRKLIQHQGACNLSQALGLQTGVMVENDCNNCNFTQVRILGFDGKYTQILIDGDPVISSLGGVYGLEHYPQEMIEQIEIVKGGGSSLYGAGAVAGTVNLLTRKPQNNSTRVGFYGSSYGGAYDQQIGAVAEIVSDSKDAGFFIFGSTRFRTEYDHNNDGFTEMGKLTNETIGFTGFVKPTGNSDLSVSFHRIFEERRGGSTLNKPVHESEIAEWTKHYKFGGKIRFEHRMSTNFSYKFNYALSLLDRDSYYGGLSEDTPEAKLEALNFYGFSQNPLHTGGFQANYIAGNHFLTAGIQFDYDKILDESVASAAYYLNEKFSNTGLYIKDEFFVGNSNQFNIIAGFRVDKHSALQDWIFSPRLSAKYQISEALKMRASYSTGFKAPQIFDEDLHICGLEGTQRVIRNAEGLKEEKSTTFSLGLEFLDFIGEIPLLFGVTLFNTDLNNAYNDEYVSSDGTIEVWRRVNTGGANAKGIEVDFGIKPTGNLEFRSGLTLKENKYSEVLNDFNTDKFLRTPDMFGYARVTFEIGDGFTLFSSLKYTGSMLVPHEIAVDFQSDPILELVSSEEFFEVDFSI